MSEELLKEISEKLSAKVKWEYKRAKWDNGIYWATEEGESEELGLEGWELVCRHVDGEAEMGAYEELLDGYFCYFKRPIQD